MSFSLSPIGNEQQVTQNGAPLSGGLLSTYLAGSSTPAATYTDSSGATPQSNPIVLNVLGRPTSPIWLADGTAYKLVLTDSAGVPQWTIDNVTGVTPSTPAQSEWETLSTTPTYINGTQFSVAGDQTTALQVGRRVRLPCTGGVRYGMITVSAYTTLTTVTVELDSGSLDAGLSAVSVGILSASNSSMPWLKSNTTGLTALGKFTLDANAVDPLEAVTLQQMQAAAAAIYRGIVRQSVQSGPVDSDGLPSFGGSIGSTTVTATGTLVVSAAGGYGTSGAVDRVGVATNPSWTGLSTNGTMYLYLDIAADGTCTTGSTTTAPSYIAGDGYSTTSGAWSFSTSEMTGKLGDGSAANQVWRMFVGQVTVSGGVVSAIVWYALRGEYRAPWTATLPGVSTAVSRNHNIGVHPETSELILDCTTTDAGYAVGDRIVSPLTTGAWGSSTDISIHVWASSLSTGFTTGASNAFTASNKTTGVLSGLTAASWRYRIVSRRGW